MNNLTIRKSVEDVRILCKGEDLYSSRYYQGKVQATEHNWIFLDLDPNDTEENLRARKKRAERLQEFGWIREWKLKKGKYFLAKLTAQGAQIFNYWYSLSKDYREKKLEKGVLQFVKSATSQ